jgi:hypothetical protein
MFRNTSTASEPEPVDVAPVDAVALSHLELDLPAPPLGWMIELDRRGIEVVADDIGRKAVSRDAARTLIAEQREDEDRRREALERQERQAVEQDRVRRASIWRGLPAVDLPVGVNAATAMLAAAHDTRPRRTTPLQEALSGESLTYHSYQTTPEDES